MFKLPLPAGKSFYFLTSLLLLTTVALNQNFNMKLTKNSSATSFWDSDARSTSQLLGGHVIFLNSISGTFMLTMSNYEGDRLQEIAPVKGSPSFSPFGDYIAAQCSNSSLLCIFDMKGVPNLLNYPPRFSDLPPLIKKKITLPSSCDISKLPPWGISSTSWSRDSKKIAFVCDVYLDNKSIDSTVCVIELNGNSNECWDKKNKPYKNVKRIDWSPKTNDFIISANGIYKVDSMGNHATLIATNGWSPSWSPDGQQIAYFRQGKNKGDFEISVLTVANSKINTIYKSFDTEDPYYKLLPACDSISGLCKLAWSPDGRFLAFSAEWTENFWVIFRIDMVTQKIIFLTVPQGGKYSEPDWGL
jgi:Tol biopolymer transport system component